MLKCWWWKDSLLARSQLYTSWKRVLLFDWDDKTKREELTFETDICNNEHKDSLWDFTGRGHGEREYKYLVLVAWAKRKQENISYPFVTLVLWNTTTCRVAVYVVSKLLMLFTYLLSSYHYCCIIRHIIVTLSVRRGALVLLSNSSSSHSRLTQKDSHFNANGGKMYSTLTTDTPDMQQYSFTKSWQ